MKTLGPTPNPTHALICAPHGRDAAVAAALLQKADVGATVCADLAALGRALDETVGFAVITDDVIRAGDMAPIVAWIDGQPSWSDLPFIVLTHRGVGPDRDPAVAKIFDVFGNVTLLERPFHPITFASVVRTAQKGRKRQFEARARVEELHESEERLRTALVAGRLGSWELDLASETLWCSETCKAIFGRGRDQPLTYQDLIAGVLPEDRARVRDAIKRSAATGSDDIIEYRHAWPDGSLHWAELRARLVESSTGAGRLVGVSADVTERKTAEEHLQRLNETLEERVAARTTELQRAHEAVLAEVRHREKAEEALQQSQKMEAIGQLTGGVAHDFNNLLTIIRASADLLRRQSLSAERQRRYVDAIADTADRAAKLTGQLLSFARRQALKPEVFSAAARVHAIGDMLRTVLGSRIELVIDVRDDVGYVEADPAQFETAVVNMAVNGRDAMDGEGRLTISVERLDRLPPIRGHAGVAGDFVAVSVSDTGLGIPPDDLSRIFEPFFTTKGVGKGTGLGLSQVFGFTKQSGGEVGVKSELSRGTKFTLYLPKVPAPEASPSAATDNAPGPARDHGRVLVVEDNVQVGEFATRLLADLGFETTLAPNAAAALNVLSATGGRFDIVFSDVVMPGMGGVDLARIIRKSWPDLPILLTSGYSHVLAEDAHHGFALLHKPYAVEDLFEALQQAMRPATSPAAEPNWHCASRAVE